MGRLIDCGEAEAAIAAHALDSLDEGEVAVLRAHLLDCPPCRRTAGAYSAIAGALALDLAAVDPPPALRARLVATAHAEASRARGGSSPRRLRPVWGATLWGLGGGLAAAALIVAAVIGFGGRQHAAPAEVIAVSGTTAQPTAHGRLDYDSSAHLAVLSADGLAPQPDPVGGSAPTYEVWLIGPGGSPEAAGYLVRAPGSSSWNAALRGDISRYRSIAVTLEPTTGRLTPSGIEVLRAELNVAP